MHLYKLFFLKEAHLRKEKLNTDFRVPNAVFQLAFQEGKAPVIIAGNFARITIDYIMQNYPYWTTMQSGLLL